MNKLKIAIVTGASSGLGKEFVKQIEHLYKELDEIWVIARRRERLEELKSCMFTNVRILEGNLCEQNIYQELKVLLKEKEPDIRMLMIRSLQTTTAPTGTSPRSPAFCASISACFI